MRARALGFVAVLLLVHGAAARIVASARAGSPRAEEARALDRLLPRTTDRIAPSLLSVRPAGAKAELARKTRTAIAIEEDLCVMDASALTATGLDDLVVEDLSGHVKKARVRGRDMRLRLVALEVEEGGLVPAPRAGHLPEAGAFVVACGTVLASGGRPTASFGIVSATGRFEGRALQVDCSIDPGNAGGALVDLEGALVGVPVLVDRKLGDDSGVGFVVPVSRIEGALARLRKGDELKAGFMGIALPYEEPEVAPSLEGGVKIDGILPDGPAKGAGLAVNDVIVKLDGVRVRTIRGLLGVLSEKCAGDEIQLVVLRSGTEVSVKLVLATR
jgi:serine protease Do